MAIGWIIPVVTAIAGAITTAVQNKKNRQATEDANEAQRRFAEETMQQQREWALEDWERVSEFNSPEQQMNRLRQAGLNPNLVYGKGADNTMDAVRSVSSPSISPLAVKHDYSGIQSVINNFQNMRSAEQSIKNAKAQYDLIQAQTMEAEQDAYNKAFDVGIKTQIRDYILNQRKAESEMKQEELERYRDLTPEKIKQEAAETLRKQQEAANSEVVKRKLEAEIKNIEAGTTLRQIEENLNAIGIQKSDPIYWRMAAQIFNKIIGEKVEDIKSMQ